MTVIRFTQVGCRQAGFKGPLLHGVDFMLARGEAMTLIGPPGCGKSTALELVLGGRAPSAGAVHVHATDCGTLVGPALAAHRLALGVVPQRGGLLANLSLAENITLPLRYHRNASPALATATLKALFRLFEVEDPPAVQASWASPTWRWIAALARALILGPEILIVDDLGDDLDQVNREDLWRLLWRVRIERGLTVLAATSDAAAAATLGERILPLPNRRPAEFRLLRASSMSLNPYLPDDVSGSRASRIQPLIDRP
jgi:ABC-type lipoprotein export system ATPase subunit